MKLRPVLTVVCATRRRLQDFQRECLLGRCLPRLGQFQELALRLSGENREPLGAVYNRAIDEARPEEVLVFVHDDVHLDDWMLAARLEEALSRFDVVGVAGNQRVQARQVTWYLQPKPVQQGGPLPWDHAHLSGAICHGDAPAQGDLNVYGPTPRPVRLLDGVFLAARAGTLQDSGVRFDADLGFHFYDLDFCLGAHQAGLRLGTWPIALTHQSRGESIHSDAWRQSCQRFLDKWYP